MRWYNHGESAATPQGTASLAQNPSKVLQVPQVDNSGNLLVNVAAGGAGGGAVTVADGADVCEGVTTDAGVVTDASGTISAKLRGLIILLLRAFALGTPLRIDPVGSTAQPVSGTVAVQAANSGGTTPYSYIAAAAANQDSTVVKNAAGTLYSLSVQNVASALRYVKIYNKATAPTSADTPALRFLIPYNATGGAGNNWTVGLPGIAFGTGISFRMTVGEADNDAAAVTANDLILNLTYS